VFVCKDKKEDFTERDEEKHVYIYIYIVKGRSQGGNRVAV